MINPYYIYIITFLTSLLVYQFGWSTLFPQLKVGLVAFLVLSMVAALVLGFIFQARGYVSYQKIPWNTRIRATVIFITILWITEFIYNGGVPLMLILSGTPYNYIEFGIPTLHVFLVTFTSFFSTYLFHVYLSTRDRRTLYNFLLCMSFAVLLFNRGMLMINIVSSGIVYLQSIRRISVGKLFGVTFILIVVLYFFGVLGNLRTSHDKEEGYSSDHIMGIVQASSSFQQGPIPSEFIWAYLYISSPIGNLQYNIDKEYRVESSPRNAVLFINNEFVFDFISKRVNAILGANRVACIRFVESLTVASTYTNCYIYLGWYGMAMMAIYILTFPILYLGLIRKSNTFYVTATSIIGSLYLFLIFDNMFTFTGLSFQLIYPLVLGRFFRSEPISFEADTDIFQPGPVPQR